MTPPAKFRIVPVAAMLMAAFCTVSGAGDAASRIVLDGSLKAGTAGMALGPLGTVLRNGVTYNQIAIPESYGRRVAGNVFQSFSNFNIGTGDAAVFTIDLPANNVISRVTGRQSSTINGLLGLDPGNTGSSPNLFFINPAGVTFGAGAAVDVPGALHVSTANYLKFPDGNFYADTTSQSTFSSADPIAFGFLGSSRAAVSINDGATISSVGQAISVVAGDIEINNASVSTQDGGDIRVVAVGAGRTEVSLQGPLPEVHGNLGLLNGGNVLTTSNGTADAGAILVGAGDISIDSQGSGFTGISSVAVPGSSGNAGNVSVSAAGSLSIVNGGLLSSDTYSSGKAGSVNVSAQTITIDNQENSSSVDSQGTSSNTGIGSYAVDGSGNSGDISVLATDTLAIVNGGVIGTDTSSPGNAGSVNVLARKLSIDGDRSDYFTGISSDSQGGTGSAGAVRVTVSGPLSILNSGHISSDTAGAGRAGAVQVNAGALVIDGGSAGSNTGISSDSLGGTGSAGTVDVKVAGSLSIRSGGLISSDTEGPGKAGAVHVSAASLAIDRSSDQTTGISSDTLGGTGSAGTVDVSVSGTLSIRSGGSISSDTEGAGNAGTVKVTSEDLVIDGGGKISSYALGGSTGYGGLVNVTASALSIASGGVISSTTWGSGDAGSVRVNAGTVRVDGKGSDSLTGISSSTEAGATGNAGDIRIYANKQLVLSNAAEVSASTHSSGRGGSIYVNAGDITIERTAEGQSSAAFLTGVACVAGAGSSNDAGSVSIHASGSLVLRNGGQVSSSSAGSGNAGRVSIDAETVTVDGQGNANTITGIASLAAGTQGSGNAGDIQVSSKGALAILNNGQITSSTWSFGHAGVVDVAAGSLKIAGSTDANARATGIFSRSEANSTGNAGKLIINVAGTTDVSTGGFISSSTLSSGHAGSVNLSAADINITGNGSGVFSNSMQAGHAGDVHVIADGTLTIAGAGPNAISSSTYSSGYAGTVSVSADKLTLDNSGIGAVATQRSSGQVGTVTIRAGSSIGLQNGGQISIQNDARVDRPELLTPTQVTVTAPRITIQDSPNAITTTSTGNVAAGSIAIKASDQLFLDPSGITTTSQDGNGGAIDIHAGTVRLENSQIATSVKGVSGNGGNISVAANTLILDTGFIQANTAAAHASGGTVAISARNLVSSGDTLFLGGSTPYTYQPGVFGFNVIQAAAPAGVSGAVHTTSPSLDISSAVIGLGVRLLDPGGLGRSPCQITAGSSMVQGGRGGFAPSARDLYAPGPRPASAQASAPLVRLGGADHGCLRFQDTNL